MCFGLCLHDVVTSTCSRHIEANCPPTSTEEGLELKAGATAPDRIKMTSSGLSVMLRSNNKQFSILEMPDRVVAGQLA